MYVCAYVCTHYFAYACMLGVCCIAQNHSVLFFKFTDAYIPIYIHTHTECFCITRNRASPETGHHPKPGITRNHMHNPKPYLCDVFFNLYVYIHTYRYTYIHTHTHTQFVCITRNHTYAMFFFNLYIHTYQYTYTHTQIFCIARNRSYAMLNRG